jgi:hypothetical protein
LDWTVGLGFLRIGSKTDGFFKGQKEEVD